MEKADLRNNLTASLARMYEMEAIGSLAEFFQGELHVLQYLCSNRDSQVNPSVLSEKLFVSRSRITAALSALRKKGYVEMEIAEDDRRRMRVTLTAKGEAFVKMKRENIERYFDILVEGLGEENVTELVRLIDLSLETMNRALDGQPGSIKEGNH